MNENNIYNGMQSVGSNQNTVQPFENNQVNNMQNNNLNVNNLQSNKPMVPKTVFNERKYVDNLSQNDEVEEKEDFFGKDFAKRLIFSRLAMWLCGPVFLFGFLLLVFGGLGGLNATLCVTVFWISTVGSIALLIYGIVASIKVAGAINSTTGGKVTMIVKLALFGIVAVYFLIKYVFFK